MDFFSTILLGIVALSGIFVIVAGFILLVTLFPVPLVLAAYAACATVYALIA
jgi:hypothetical protein